jgi:cbb3-type cytochrome oxidase subunit 3
MSSSLYCAWNAIGVLMKIFIGVSLIFGMLIFQSNLFNGQLKTVAAIIGLLCFIGLVIWLFFSNKKRGSDPAVMLNDIDSD